MIATLTALIFAHVVADFIMQTNAMVRSKSRVGIMALHAAIVLLTAQAATGQIAAPALLIVALTHITIDAIKTYGGFRSFTAFMLDQAAHIVTLVAIAAYAPTLWENGAWSAHPWILPLLAILAGLILALSAGQHAVAILMNRYRNSIRSNGLRDGGRLIGLLERGLIFLFILTGQPIGVGFLIGAKSILRFGTASRDQRTAEYVIIGTLASFGWAIGAALLTQGALSVLPPLEIARLTP